MKDQILPSELDFRALLGTSLLATILERFTD
jgi:hypothetical protein